jgi:hypothetical protein
VSHSSDEVYFPAAEFATLGDDPWGMLNDTRLQRSLPDSAQGVVRIARKIVPEGSRDYENGKLT